MINENIPVASASSNFSNMVLYAKEAEGAAGEAEASFLLEPNMFLFLEFDEEGGGEAMLVVGVVCRRRSLDD
jgi:hypothetical protein